MSSSAHAAHADTLAARVQDATGESVFECYQCGKCTAGCPLTQEMDFAPSQVLRLLQLALPDMEQEVLGSYAIWLCLTCETCISRCPKEVDLPKVMDYLRQEALRRGTVHPKAKDILAFHESFLGSIRKNGRLHEVGLVAAYKLKTFHLLQDVLVAPALLARGKLSLLPHGTPGKDQVQRIFDKCEAEPTRIAPSSEHKADHP
jgi:heterodisulfide reductase subunit C2